MSQNQTIQTNHPNDTLRIELFIARLLRWGVIFSFCIITLGIGLVILTGQTGFQQIHLDDVNSLVQYQVKPNFPNALSSVFYGVVALKPYAIITLGLLVLIAIPVMRVAVSVVAFVVERDWLYVAITAFVLLALLASFALGEAGG
jgi:uncharacterized membrane protein